MGDTGKPDGRQDERVFIRILASYFLYGVW